MKRCGLPFRNWKLSNGERFTPLPGSEDQFERLEQCIIQLKAICQAMQSEGVRKSLAEWDDKILTHQEPEMRL